MEKDDDDDGDGDKLENNADDDDSDILENDGDDDDGDQLENDDDDDDNDHKYILPKRPTQKTRRFNWKQGDLRENMGIKLENDNEIE